MPDSDKSSSSRLYSPHSINDLSSERKQMSKKHPVIALPFVRRRHNHVKIAFEHIFIRKTSSTVIEGDSFHSLNRAHSRKPEKKPSSGQHHFSHFGPEANHFDKIEALFKSYGETGTGKKRYYCTTPMKRSAQYRLKLKTKLGAGEFTPWEDIPAAPTSCSTKACTAWWQTARLMHPSMWIWASAWCYHQPEWIQKIHRDAKERGYSAEATVETILRRMPDYINYVTPQFSRTDVNFQRVPTVDTSTLHRRDIRRR